MITDLVGGEGSAKILDSEQDKIQNPVTHPRNDQSSGNYVLHVISMLHIGIT